MRVNIFFSSLYCVKLKLEIFVSCVLSIPTGLRYDVHIYINTFIKHIVPQFQSWVPYREQPAGWWADC